MKMTTTTFTCPEHGKQNIEAPAFLERRMCTACAHALEQDKSQAEREHAQAMSRWHNWTTCGISHRHRGSMLDNWIPANKSQQAARGVFSSWVGSIPDRSEDGLGLVVFGPVGVGKTHVLSALVTACHQAGVNARYVVWPDVIERRKATFNNREHADRDLLDHLARVPVLALDELGVRAGSEFDQALLFGLIDARYRDQLVTLAATNLTEATLDSIGERTADRLRECTVPVTLTGASQRSNVRALLPPAIERPEPWTIEREVTINGKREVVTRSAALPLPGSTSAADDFVATYLMTGRAL